MKNFILQLIAVAYLASNQAANAIPIGTANAPQHTNYQLVEKIRRKNKDKDEFDPAMLGLVGGILGGVTNIVGASVGGDAGDQIMKAGTMVNNVSTAAASGDTGKIVQQVANGAASFVPDSNTASMVSGIGNSVGNTVNAGIEGDVTGAMKAASGATAYIPGMAGNILSTGLVAGGNIVADAKTGNTAGIVGNVGGAIGQIVPGQAGLAIQSLTPVAQSMTNQIQQGNIGAAVNQGLNGVSAVVPNQVVAGALQTAAGTAGQVVNYAIAGDSKNALQTGLTTVNSTGSTVQNLLNGVPSATPSQTQAAVSTGQTFQTVVNAGTAAAAVVSMEADSLPNVAGTTKILSLN